MFPKVTHNDETFSEINPNTGGPRQIAVFSNYNDEHVIEQEGPYLLGLGKETTEEEGNEKGVTKHVEVQSPLILEEGEAEGDPDILRLDPAPMDAVEEDIEALDTRVTALETDVATKASDADLTAEETARAAADAALDTRLDALELDTSVLIPAYTGTGSRPSTVGLPAGKTLIGFRRDTNELEVYDPDGATWLQVSLT